MKAEHIAEVGFKIAAWINECGALVIDDRKLIGLNAFADDQIRKLYAQVSILIVKEVRFVVIGKCLTLADVS